MGILMFQLLIATVIVLSTIKWKEKGLFLATVATVAWSLLTIFSNWLLAIQFVTIYLAYQFSKKKLLNSD